MNDRDDDGNNESNDERKQQESVNIGLSMYRSLFDYAPDGIVVADQKSYYLDANASICKMLGYTRDELVGLHASEIVTQIEVEHIEAALDATKKKGNYVREWQLRRKDGSVFSAEVIETIMPDGNLLGIIRDITERKQAEIYSKHLAAIVESSGDAIIGKDLNGIVTSWNLGAEKIFGYMSNEMLGTSITKLIPADLQDEEHMILEKIRRGERVNHFETLRQAKDQRLIEVSITVSPIKDSRGNIIGASKIARDISILKAHERKIVRLSQLYAALSQCNQAIVRCTNEMELLPQICRDAVKFGGMKMAWIGMLDESTRLVKPCASFGSGIEYLDGIEISVTANNPAGLGPTGTALREQRPIWSQDIKHDTTMAFWHERATKFGWGSAAALPLHRKGNAVGVFVLYSDVVNAFDKAVQDLLMEMAMDISFALDRFHDEAERKREQDQLAYLANFDVLTGLPNRTQLERNLKYALCLAKRNKGHLAVLFIDVDRFKDINDTLGHSIGDAFLIEIARRFRSILREEDTLSRRGGDEFVLVLSECSAQGAAQVAEKLLQVISHPSKIEQYDLLVTASIGIALYPEDGVDIETLAKSADTAMYRAKHEGRNTYRFFTTEMQVNARRNMELINSLRQALERDQLHLHYQPQISIQDGRIIGVEALLRWRHPELGNISPAEFIPVAEDSRLILSIGEWVLREAINQLKRWTDSGYPAMVVAVNLSAVQFRHPNLPDMVSTILREAQLPPEYLELELTERVAMHDPQEAIAVMNELHQRGIRMSIDDFGTGYSSLSYLKKFKVYKLKIDQSFVRDISTDLEDKAIVAAIIGMAKNLGMKTIAEGVETIDQLDYLQNEGCDEAQGYYFSRPHPPQQIEAFITGKNA